MRPRCLPGYGASSHSGSAVLVIHRAFRWSTGSRKRCESSGWLIGNVDAYYEAQKRGAPAIIGLLVDSPTDGCEFYVPYDGHLKALPAVWVGREHATKVRGLARASERVRLVSAGENHLVDSHN